MKALVIAGAASGCGKTSFTLGLLRCIARRGAAVAPFKSGPDFIDPGLHARACGHASHNLDTWMCAPDVVRALFAQAGRGADIAVVEGAMGVFDGASPTREDGSTAQLAKLLNLPVALVLDVRAMARSAAALARGYADFDPGLTPLLASGGLVPNRLGSARHEDIIRQALAAHLPRIPVLAALHRMPDPPLKSRHLGLITAEDAELLEQSLDALADWVQAHLDVDGLLDRLPDVEAPRPAARMAASFKPKVRIGLARDAAFCFSYGYNLQALQQAGAELVPFSPLADVRLPPDLDGLYLPGGYPELHGPALQGNRPMREAVAGLCASGKPVYAECGGFMYLMRSIERDGAAHAMCGVFPFSCRMLPRRAALGYRQVTLARPTPLGPAGTVARGHEFHYSAIAPQDETAAAALAGAYTLEDKDGPLNAPEGFGADNLLASYVHLHFGSCPGLAENFAAACRKAKSRG